MKDIPLHKVVVLPGPQRRARMVREARKCRAKLVRLVGWAAGLGAVLGVTYALAEADLLLQFMPPWLILGVMTGFLCCFSKTALLLIEWDE